MKTKNRFVTIFLLIIYVVAFQAPAMQNSTQAAGLPALNAAGSSISLTITNPLPKSTTITLTGPKSYTISVLPGATVTRTIASGKYKFSYPGCLNKTMKGNLKVKKITATVKIAPCKMATWIWYNADHSRSATIRLKGWVNYSVTVGPGQIVPVSWVADTYQITLTACGKTVNDTLKVNGKKRWIIYACK